MPPPRFWVSLVWSFVLRVRDVARVAALPLGVTSVVGLVLVPIPWEEDRASAARAAKVRPHEVVSLRDARSKTRVTEDGSMVTTLARQSLHWFDRGERVWRPIDSDLAPSAKTDVGWVSGSNRFTVEVAEETKVGAGLLTIKGRAGELALGLEGATPGKQGTKSTKNGVAFKDVRANVDLEYVVLPDGVKENIVLRSAAAPSSYTFRFTPGAGEEWRAEELEKSGLWQFYVDGSPEPGFVLLPPSVGDSSQIPREAISSSDGVPRWVNTAVGKASLKVEREDDGSFLATVSVDEKWLKDSARVFPVVLDPTVYSEPDTADGWYDTSNGSNTQVLDSVLKQGAHGVGAANLMSVLRFDMATIPPAAKVVDAKLNAWLDNCFPGVCDGGNWGTMRLRRLTVGWNAATQWSTISGGIDATSLATVDYASGVTPTIGWQTWTAGPLTTAIQGMVNGSITNNGFILDKSAGNPNNGFALRSSRWSDPSYAPYLDVRFPRFSGHPSAWSESRSVLKEERYATEVSAALSARVSA